MEDSAWEKLLKLYQAADDKDKFLEDIDAGLYSDLVDQVDEDIGKAAELQEAIQLILSLDDEKDPE